MAGPINRDFVAASFVFQLLMVSLRAGCVFVADCNVGWQAAGMFGYRLAGNCSDALVAILRRTIARAMPIM